MSTLSAERLSTRLDFHLLHWLDRDHPATKSCYQKATAKHFCHAKRQSGKDVIFSQLSKSAFDPKKRAQSAFLSQIYYTDLDCTTRLIRLQIGDYSETLRPYRSFESRMIASLLSFLRLGKGRVVAGKGPDVIPSIESFVTISNFPSETKSFSV